MKTFKSFITEPLLEFKNSNTHGIGVFTIKEIKSDESICLFLQSLQTEHNDYIRSDVARLINHSTTPNLNIQKQDSDVYVVSNKDIQEGEELFINYFDVLEIVQPRVILKDSFIRLYPHIDSDLLKDTGPEFREELELLRKLK